MDNIWMKSFQECLVSRYSKKNKKKKKKKTQQKTLFLNITTATFIRQYKKKNIS